MHQQPVDVGRGKQLCASELRREVLDAGRLICGGQSGVVCLSVVRADLAVILFGLTSITTLQDVKYSGTCTLA